mgnify:CR=1 FL=1
MDTLFSMVIGWAINSAMIIISAALFFSTHSEVTEIAQAQIMLEPMLGKGAALLFAVALLFCRYRVYYDSRHGRRYNLCWNLRGSIQY